MPKLDYSIRFAKPTDVPMIVKMIFELAVYEKAEDQCFATEDKIHEQLFGPKPNAECIVAVVNDKAVGMALYFHNFSTWEAAPGIYLEDLYVRTTYRKHGIGMALIECLASIAEDRGCIRFEWSVLDWNKPARDFYESFGSKAQTEWITYRTEGDPLKKLAQNGKKLLQESKAKADAKLKEQLLNQNQDNGDLLDANGDVITIYTDGGSDPNPGVGAWAYVLSFGDVVYKQSNGELGTTNNRMELSATIQALKSLAPNQKVMLVTDSQYVKNGITTWIKNWKKNNWRRGKSKTEPVKNVDLWLQLDHLVSIHKVTWDWVKGHSGNDLNEECDELCTEKIHELKASSTEKEREVALNQLELDQAMREQQALQNFSGGDLFGS